jgi:hypothetical protein
MTEYGKYELYLNSSSCETRNKKVLSEKHLNPGWVIENEIGFLHNKLGDYIT